MSYEYLLGMGTEEQPAAASEQVSVTVPVANDEEDARHQLAVYQYLRAVEAARSRDEGAMERLQELVQQPAAVEKLHECSEFDSGQQSPSFDTPDAQERYEQMCLAVQMARDTAAGQDPFAETLMGALKIGAVFGSIATIAGGFTLYRLYKKYKEYKEGQQTLAEKAGGET